MTLNLNDANSIVNGAITKARELNVNVSVAVCDKLGRLIAFNRMDGAYVTANRFAIGKAVVSAGTGLPSGEVAGIVNHPETDTAVAEGVTQPAFEVVYRFCEETRSRVAVALMGRHPTNKMRSALTLASPACVHIGDALGDLLQLVRRHRLRLPGNLVRSPSG
jgi:uncharacterized protein GlcG (DUF336 family)